jgi:hypothetical protein
MGTSRLRAARRQGASRDTRVQLLCNIVHLPCTLPSLLWFWQCVCASSVLSLCAGSAAPGLHLPTLPRRLLLAGGSCQGRQASCKEGKSSSSQEEVAVEFAGATDLAITSVAVSALLRQCVSVLHYTRPMLCDTCLVVLSCTAAELSSSALYISLVCNPQLSL